MISPQVKSEVVFCQLCGQKITTSSKTFHHKNWPRGVSLRVCQDCLKKNPRCRICGIPVALVPAEPDHDSNGLCATCRNLNADKPSTRLCLACGKLVTGKYYEFDGVGPYCKDCFRKRPPCDVCGAPLTDEKWQLSDGRLTCSHCHSTAIYSPVDAKRLYEEMKRIVSQRMELKLNVPTGLALVDRNQLSRVIHLQSDRSDRVSRDTPPSDATGQTYNNIEKSNTGELDPQRTLGIYARRGMRRGIYVQTGLPRVLFLQVAAHEYAHAWQGENCPTLRDPMIHEGFAEWLAFHVMGYFRYSKGQARMLGRNDLYGKGLKWALDLETMSGEGGVIHACRRSIEEA